MSKKYQKICTNPFTVLNLFESGDIYPCCPIFTINNHSKPYFFGNIFTDNITLEEIWNSSKAQEFRRSILTGEYKYCNLDTCIRDYNNNHVQVLNSDILPIVSFPTTINISLDKTCNFKCIFCRDDIIYSNNHNLKRYDLYVDRILSILKHVKYINTNSFGELFTSSLTRKFIKKITHEYPNIRFNLITNGSLCNEKNLSELNMIDKLNDIEVSLHSLSKKTHQIITGSNTYDDIIKNIKWLSLLKSKDKLQDLKLNFVVTSFNYKEIIPFTKWALSIGARVNISEMRDISSNHVDRYFYYNLIKIFNNDIFLKNIENNNIRLSKTFKDIYEKSYVERR